MADLTPGDIKRGAVGGRLGDAVMILTATQRLAADTTFSRHFQARLGRVIDELDALIDLAIQHQVVHHGE